MKKIYFYTPKLRKPADGKDKGPLGHKNLKFTQNQQFSEPFSLAFWVLPNTFLGVSHDFMTIWIKIMQNWEKSGFSSDLKMEYMVPLCARARARHLCLRKHFFVVGPTRGFRLLCWLRRLSPTRKVRLSLATMDSHYCVVLSLMYRVQQLLIYYHYQLFLIINSFQFDFSLQSYPLLWSWHPVVANYPSCRTCKFW